MSVCITLLRNEKLGKPKSVRGCIYTRNFTNEHWKLPSSSSFFLNQIRTKKKKNQKPKSQKAKKPKPKPKNKKTKNKPKQRRKNSTSTSTVLSAVFHLLSASASCICVRWIRVEWSAWRP